MDAPYSITSDGYSFTLFTGPRHTSLVYIGDTPVASAFSIEGALAVADCLGPRYELLLDVSASDLDYDDLPTDAPGEDSPTDGPQPAPEDARDYSREALAEIDHLCRCADGEFILDWAMVDALEAHVRRALRDLSPAASPTPPVAPSLQPPSAGGDAANAAGPCDVSGCAAPGSTVWLGRWPAYPARLCSAHGTVVA